MAEAEVQQSAAGANKCAYIQEPEPLEQTAIVDSLTPMETVEADAELAVPPAAASSGNSPLDQTGVGDAQIKVEEREADPAGSSSCHNASDSGEQTKPAAGDLQKCPNCLISRVSLIKYGSRPGEKRLKCFTCNRWFGDVVKGCSVEKRDMGPPPAKVARRGRPPSRVVDPQPDPPPSADLLNFLPLTTSPTTSAQSHADDLLLANLKQEMTGASTLDKDDVGCLKRKLKMAQIMLRESRVKIDVVERQRDDAVKLLRTLRSAIYQFKVDFHSNMRRLQEDQSFLADQYATYLKELARGVDKERKALDGEKTRVKLMFDHCETKRRNLKAQLECKKEQLKQSQHETAMETRRCDVLTRDAYLSTLEADQAKKNLNDKLFLGTNQKCATCTASERVRGVLANQIAEKSNENDELRQQREQLRRKCEEKDRICQMLTKTNERLQFEVNALNNDNKRMLADINRRAVLEKEEGAPSTPGSGASLPARQNPQPNPSPPSSDQSNESDAAVSASPSSQSKKSSQIPPEPPPPPPTEPDDCAVTEADKQQDTDKKTSAIDWDLLLNDKDWLRSQLEGCWELLVWYRKELKGAVEQKMYFADRLEGETDAVETLIETKDAELTRLQHALTLKTDSHEQLTVQLSQLTQNLNSYFASNPSS